MNEKTDIRLDVALYFVLFVPLCILYYIACNGFFQNFPQLYNYTNEHDHLLYVSTIKHISEGNLLLGINNNVGIALIYMGLVDLFSLVGITDIKLIAFIVNMLTLTHIYFLYTQICKRLNLVGLTRLFFFLGFQFLYFTQLINKDLFTIQFFLLCCKAMLDGKIAKIALYSILYIFVRIQLVIFGGLCIFLYKGNLKWRLIIAYVATALLGGITAAKGELISDETMGSSGFSVFLISFNRSFFYLGNLIFNPLRALQFFLSVLMSFNIYTNNLVDITKILRLPLLIAMLIYIKPLIASISKFSLFFKLEIKSVYIVLISFALTWLINPTINARYVMLILPFLIILARFIEVQQMKKF